MSAIKFLTLWPKHKYHRPLKRDSVAFRWQIVPDAKNLCSLLKILGRLLGAGQVKQKNKTTLHQWGMVYLCRKRLIPVYELY
jgi:hypothetical protein